MNIQKYINENKVLPPPVVAKTSLYPVFTKRGYPDISAKAALVLDSDSKVVLYYKRPTLRFSMASTTKIMTAQVALDHYKPDDILTVKSEGVEGVNIGFKKGQSFTFLDLLYAMLLPSGNDAALAIAQNYPGGEKAFVNKMNEKAKFYNLDNTHFADAMGILDEQDYTTAIDLARLASAALKNKVFAEVVATKRKVISDIDGLLTYSIYNLNKLLGVDGVNGVKTGYTSEAGQVLVTSKFEPSRVLGASSSPNSWSSARNGKSVGKEINTIIIIVMGSQDRFLDTKKLLDLVSGNVNYLSIHP